MKYSAQEIKEYVKEEDVKFIRLVFCDILGRQKNISIMPDELDRAFEYGIAFDGSAIYGFEDVAHSDLFLRPDPDTISVLPWRPDNGKVVRMYCNITDKDGKPFSNDTRLILMKAINKASQAGLSFSFGSELEFYLFKLDEEGNRTEEPYDQAGYMDLAPEDKGENVRREICLTLEQMGIYPESSHHEEGPGQNEIDFRYSDALNAADNTLTFLTVVKAIAAKHGLYADFTAKPLVNKPGNGFHINISCLDKEGNNLKQPVITGILKHIKEMTVFLNSSENSYERLGLAKAPKYISWSTENRSQLVRIPAAFDKYSRVELRSGDALTNPYLAFALIIYATLESIENNYPLPPSVDLNMFEIDATKAKELDCLPIDLANAKAIAKSSEFINKYLPSELINQL